MSTSTQDRVLAAQLALHAPVAVAAFGADLRCRYANTRFARLVRRPRERVPGLGWGDLFPSSGDRQEAAARSVAAGGEPVRLNLPIGTAPARRRGDADSPAPRTRSGLLYGVTAAAGPPLVGLMVLGGRDVSAAGEDDGDLGAVILQDAGDLAVRIRSALVAAGRSPSSVALLSAVHPPGAEVPPVDPALVAAAFRETDAVAVLGPAMVVVLCERVTQQADAVLLAERFKAALAAGRTWAGHLERGPGPSAVPGHDDLTPNVCITFARAADTPQRLMRRVGVPVRPGPQGAGLRRAAPSGRTPLR